MSQDGRWVKTTRGSLFAFHPYEFSPGENWSVKITFTRYCKEKNISRDQGKTFIRKKWLAITRFKGRIWVHEICPDQIQDFLS